MHSRQRKSQKHRTKGKSSTSSFLVECAADDAEDFRPIFTVMWNDGGPELHVIEFDVDVAAPQSLADALRKLAS